MSQTYKIFIASSSELKDDRDKFRTFISLQNDELNKKGIYLELIQWEYFNDSVGLEGKQNDYNEAIKSSDMFISLFFTKAGKYSEQEFDVAYNTFTTSKKPKIWAYFKNAPVDVGSLTADNIISLSNFKKKLDDLKHFYTVYTSIDNLQNQFCRQLDLFIDENAPPPMQVLPPVNTIDKDHDEIYFCDRKIQSQLFDNTLIRNDTIQFHLISCHERDMPQYFIKRKKLEYEESDTKTIDLFVNPTITPDNTYEQVEQAINASIKEQWNKNGLLKNYKLKPFEDVTIENVITILTQLNYDFLLITWQIRSIYWKSDTLKNHINAFYEKFALKNMTLKTDKKVFLIGVVSYTEDANMTREEFEQKINDIRYGVGKIKLTKITVPDIKEWLETYVEDNPDIQEKIIIKNQLNKQSEYFMSELEIPLKDILTNVH